MISTSRQKTSSNYIIHRFKILETKAPNLNSKKFSFAWSAPTRSSDPPRRISNNSTSRFSSPTTSCPTFSTCSSALSRTSSRPTSQDSKRSDREHFPASSLNQRQSHKSSSSTRPPNNLPRTSPLKQAQPKIFSQSPPSPKSPSLNRNPLFSPPNLSSQKKPKLQSSRTALRSE